MKTRNTAKPSLKNKYEKRYKKPVKKLPTREQYANQHWIYGEHAVWEALGNPRRTNRELWHIHPLSADQLAKINACQANQELRYKPCEKTDLQQLFGQQAVHQGLGLLTDPLPELSLEDADQAPIGVAVSSNPSRALPKLWVALDGVTDPHNVGAMVRLVAALGGVGIILPRNGSPALTPTLHKVAAGGIEHIHVVYVNSLPQALETLQIQGYQIIGLDERAEDSLDQFKPTSASLVMVMGAEGEGLKKSTRRICDHWVKIPTQSHFPSLNVGTAAAITLYQLFYSEPLS